MDRLTEIQQWHGSLPDVITEFTVNIKKRLTEQLIDELGEGERVTINYGEGLERGFQVVKVDVDERILWEVVMKNGKPKKQMEIHRVQDARRPQGD